MGPFGLTINGELFGHLPATVPNPSIAPFTSGPFGTVSTLATINPGWFSSLGNVRGERRSTPTARRCWHFSPRARSRQEAARWFSQPTAIFTLKIHCWSSTPLPTWSHPSLRPWLSAQALLWSWFRSQRALETGATRPL